MDFLLPGHLITDSSPEDAFQPYLCKRSHKHPQDDPAEFGVVLKVSMSFMNFIFTI